MPKGSANPLTLYGISRGENCWLVTIVRDGHRYRKQFHFGKYGVGAGLKLAKAWRDEIVAGHPALSRHICAQRPRKDTSQEIPGIVCQHHPDGRPKLWTAQTQCGPERRLRKSFSVGRYGEQGAKALAIQERQRQLAHLRGVVLGTPDSRRQKLLEHYTRDVEQPVVRPARTRMATPSTGVLNRSNTSGFAGVYVMKDQSGKPRAWVARTRAGGHTQFEVFSIAKHGDAAAQTLAIAKRRQQLKKVMRVRDGSETNMNSKGAA
jgi:hypothetical protein